MDWKIFENVDVKRSERTTKSPNFRIFFIFEHLDSFSYILIILFTPERRTESIIFSETLKLVRTIIQ